MADRPLSVKLRPWLERELRRELEAPGERVAEGLRRILEEWWAERRFLSPAIRQSDLSAHVQAIRGWCDRAGEQNPVENTFAWLGPAEPVEP